MLLLLLAFTALRLIFWFTAFPNPDESYYWLWGQHPALSYYDHPPLQAWVQGIFTAVLGRSRFTLRLPNLISNAVFFYTYYRITCYLYRDKAVQAFWLIVLMVLASPLYFLFLALAWHDHLLITFALVALFLLITFLDGYVATGKGDSWRLYGASVALGLSGLCKYNAVFVPLGILMAVMVDRRLRPLLRDRRLYLAGAIAASALLPILLWNLSNDWQSFRYYVDRSVNTGSFSLRFDSCLGFLLFSVLTVSPVNCIGFYRRLRQFNQRTPNQRTPIPQTKSVYPAIAFWVFATSTAILTAISLVSAALYYWNITAYLLLFPLLPMVFLKGTGDREQDESYLSSSIPPPSSLLHPLLTPQFLPGQAFGLLFAALLIVHYCVLPLSALVSREADPDSRMLFGWEAVAAAVRSQASELGGDNFWVTTDYRSASALAYQLNDRTVTAISDRVDQFDFWQSETQRFQGKNAVILADDWHPIQPELLSHFAQTSPPVTVPITRFGVWIKDYYVLKGYRFQP